MYGKYQLNNDKLIYFDNNLTLGIANVSYAQQVRECVGSKELSEKFSALVFQDKNAMAFTIGAGQKYFFDKNNSVNWSLRNRSFQTSHENSKCEDESSSETEYISNLTFQFGYSYFL